MGKKLDSLKKALEDIEKELDAIKVFRQTPQLRAFQRQLIGERSFIKEQIRKLTNTEEQKKREWIARLAEANTQRREKMKRTWRYMRSLQENYFPDKNLKEIRSLYRKHRDGLDSSINDVVWQNPSP